MNIRHDLVNISDSRQLGETVLGNTGASVTPGTSVHTGPGLSAGTAAENASAADLVDYFDDMQGVTRDGQKRKKTNAIGHTNVQEIEDRLETIFEILVSPGPKAEAKLLQEISALQRRKKEIEGS